MLLTCCDKNSFWLKFLRLKFLKSRAFTLIELMVVVSVLGVLGLSFRSSLKKVLYDYDTYSVLNFCKKINSALMNHYLIFNETEQSAVTNVFCCGEGGSFCTCEKTLKPFLPKNMLKNLDIATVKLIWTGIFMRWFEVEKVEDLPADILESLDEIVETMGEVLENNYLFSYPRSVNGMMLLYNQYYIWVKDNLKNFLLKQDSSMKVADPLFKMHEPDLGIESPYPRHKEGFVSLFKRLNFWSTEEVIPLDNKYFF